MFFCFYHVLTKRYHYDQLNKNQWLAKFSGFIYSCFLSITIKLELIILFCLLHNLPPNTQLTLKARFLCLFFQALHQSFLAFFQRITIQSQPKQELSTRGVQTGRYLSVSLVTGDPQTRYR